MTATARRAPVFLIVAALTAAGCAGDPGLSDCAAVAEAAVDVIQQTIDVLEESAAGAEPDEDRITGIEEAGAQLEQRAAELECTEAEMSELMAGLAGRLEARTALGQQLIESLRAGTGGFFEGG